MISPWKGLQTMGMSVNLEAGRDQMCFTDETTHRCSEVAGEISPTCLNSVWKRWTVAERFYRLQAELFSPQPTNAAWQTAPQLSEFQQTWQMWFALWILQQTEGSRFGFKSKAL